MNSRRHFAIVRRMNRETIHHLAEVALLRDLYTHRVTNSANLMST